MRKPIVSKPAGALLAFAALLCMAVAPAWAGQRKVQRKIAPEYPELAKRMNIRGSVYVETKVAPDGSVTEAHAVDGNRLLASAAEKAVRKWKFAPEQHSSREKVEVEFKLANWRADQVTETAGVWLPIPR